MIQRFYRYINGRFIIFYEVRNEMQVYPKNSIGYYLWVFHNNIGVDDKKKNKAFEDLQILLKTDDS